MVDGQSNWNLLSGVFAYPMQKLPRTDFTVYMVNNNLILEMRMLYLKTNFNYRQIQISSKDIRIYFFS